MTLEDAAARIIRANRYLTMATMGTDGPWAAPLAFTVEPDFTFVFYSASDARHSKHILANPVVACAIFNSTLPSDEADGVQFQGRCSVVLGKDLSDLMTRYFEQSFPDKAVRARWHRPVSDFIAPAPQRFYRIVLDAISKPDPASTRVDKRVTLDLEKVKSAYFKR